MYYHLSCFMLCEASGHEKHNHFAVFVMRCLLLFEGKMYRTTGCEILPADWIIRNNDSSLDS